MKCRLLRLARANSTARARQLGKVIVGGVYAAKVFQMASILTLGTLVSSKHAG